MSHFRRPPTHAGSWYVADKQELRSQLQHWMSEVNMNSWTFEGRRCAALIVPHAGYRYSGETAAHAFAFLRNMSPRPKRVFVLGPSHRGYFQGCALTACQTYETPLGSFHVDQDVVETLRQTCPFENMNQDWEWDEHSLEMQLPFLYEALRKESEAMPRLIPVLVGAISEAQEAAYGHCFASYLAHPDNLFVISSDFCHWGKRFGYTYLPASDAASSVSISEGIRQLDEQGMQFISKMDVLAFHHYLKQTGNTICGRHPIGILLNALQEMKPQKPCVEFMHYAQSNPAQSKTDSSVSYAAAVLSLCHE